MDGYLLQNLSLTGVCLPAVLLLLIIYYFRRSADPNRHRYPPGPGYALPLIGNLYQLGTSPHLTFQKWKKTYGPMIYFKFGSQNAVIVNDPKLLTELCSTVAAAGKPTNAVWTMFSNSGHGIISSGGENAREQRNFAMKILSELGLSKSGKLEGIILDEADNIVKYFEARVGGGVPFRATRIFHGAVVSTLWSIVAGEKVEWLQDGGGGDGGVVTETELTKCSREVLEEMNKALKLGLPALPGLRFLPGFHSVWNKLKTAIDNFHRAIEAKIQSHAETLDVESPRDFIDHGLIKVGATTDPSSSFYKEKGRLNLRTAVKDLYIAASETSSTALEYVLMYLGTHPKIQERLFKELDDVVGGNRPTLSDRKMLPITEAVIMETLRRSGSVALKSIGMQEDFELGGYLLPKGTYVFGDLYSILRDEESWGKDVDDFRPERFLNEDETKVVHHPAWLPFSPGRRNCIGEALAMDTLLLCVVSIFQRFRVEVVGGGVVDLDNVKPGVTLELEPFDIRVYRRRNNK